MAAENDPATLLRRIRELARSAQADGSAEALRAALNQISTLASEGTDGDTPEPSDIPKTENQTL